MGATEFATRSKGKTAQEAFRAAVEQARYDYGHAGYTGTIAEKRDFAEFRVPDGFSVREFVKVVSQYDQPDLDGLSQSAKRTIAKAREVYDDKWGPAVAIQAGPDEWLFCGWASS